VLRLSRKKNSEKVSRQLPGQGALLLGRPWNVLLVLDACRFDYFREWEPETRRVGSMGSITWAWVAGLVEVVRRLAEPVLYVTANPVVNREMRKYPDMAIHMLSPWKDRWGRHGPLDLPTVHPGDLAECVRQYVSEHGQPRRMVVHFVQPHVPFIGRRSIPYSGWGRDMSDTLSREVKKLPHVRDALSQGLVSMEEVRRCYRDNVELVAEHRARLSADLRGLVVTTADHGELLGERGLYGHTAGPAQPELLEVPWLEEQRGPYRPTPIAAHLERADAAAEENEHMKQRLEALGYA